MHQHEDREETGAHDGEEENEAHDEKNEDHQTDELLQDHAEEEEHLDHQEDHEHDEDEHHEDHEEHAEITAMLMKFNNPMGMIQYPRMVNENTSMQAAVPSYEINRLFGLMGIGVDTLSTIALVIMIVSGLSVFISLYSALKDRKYEMALMRTYGATRWQLFWLVLQEGLLLTLIGFILGILISRTGLFLASGIMESNYHYALSKGQLLAEEGWLLLIAVLIGLLASIIPAIQVFKLNISKTLADA